MTKRNDNSSPTSPISAAVAQVILKAVVPPSLTSLFRALDISVTYDWKLDLEDLERVEAFWELLDLDSTSHGFVLALRDRRRCYLQYVMAPDGDEAVEDVQLLPMGDERYPSFSGGGVVWNDEVEELNRLLAE